MARTVFDEMMGAEMERIGAVVPVGRVHKEMEARLAVIAEHEQNHDGQRNDCPYCERDHRIAAEKEKENMDCKHPKDERHFSEDGLLEWCGKCGALICDHHERKFGTPHPQL